MASVKRYQLIDDRVVTYYKVIVDILSYDSNDSLSPEYYLNEWIKTEKGLFVLGRTASPVIIHKNLAFDSLELRIAIEAELEEKHLSEFYFKFGKV